MIKRLVCRMLGHAWDVFPQWITGERNTMRVCERCRLVQAKLIHVGVNGSNGLEWRDVGRRTK